jgi:uncharacterized protein
MEGMSAGVVTAPLRSGAGATAAAALGSSLRVLHRVAPDAFGTLNDQVVVYGTASRSVAPDVAMLDVSVKDVDADPGAAFERCVPRLNEVVARLSALVGGAGQVTTGNVGVHRDYELEDEEERLVHAASGEVAVECPLDLAPQVMSQSAALGVDEFSLRYSVRDPSEVREELLAVAVSTARRKAERLAQAGERSLGAIVGVEELSSENWRGDHAGIELASAEVELQPADLTVAVSVRVTFTLA